jgi:hypothetical protein
MQSIRDVSQRDACFPEELRGAAPRAALPSPQAGAVMRDLLHLARVLFVIAVILVLDGPFTPFSACVHPGAGNDGRAG